MYDMDFMYIYYSFGCKISVLDQRIGETPYVIDFALFPDLSNRVAGYDVIVIAYGERPKLQKQDLCCNKPELDIEYSKRKHSVAN